MNGFAFRWLGGLLLGSMAFAVAGADKATLTGTVSDFGGDTMKGARVYIYAAKHKDADPGGSDSMNHPDCGKKAVTDEKGKFRIEGLDPNYLFRVLVAAKEHAPKFVPEVDPSEEPIEVFLQPGFPDDGPKRRMRGRVVDGAGKPVSGALVTTRGVTRGEGTRFGGNRDIDKETVSDDEGIFEIRGEEDFDAVGVDVVAPGLAKAVFTQLATGEKVHELKLTPGATVKGRLIKEGKPLVGIEVGISGADRSSEVYVGNFKEATDEQGRFTFANLPPRTTYSLYGIMKSLREQGALATQTMRTEEGGSTNDLGDVALAPAYVLEGLIKMKDGTVPPPIRLNLSREEAWDSQQTEIDDEGKFRFVGVPAERVSLSARLRGYRLSMKNVSLDPWNPYHLVGRMVGDKTNLVVEIEEGENVERWEGDHESREEPLTGAEGAGKPGEIKITGTVVDAESGQPIAAFTTTEGRSAQWPPEHINWLTRARTEQTNGAFTVHLAKRGRAPALLFEADDYLPFSSGPISVMETNLVVKLKKGSGIEGVVKNPEGMPIAGAKVYLTDMKEGVYVQGERLEVRENVYRSTQSVEADEKGYFKFPPKVDAYNVIVVDASGYGEVKIEELGKSKEVRLKPYAVVKGKLMIGSRPGANETVRLGMAHLMYEHHPRHFPPLQMYLTTKTDDEGKFEFARVAPVAVQVYHEPKVKDGRMGTIATSQEVKLQLEPGRTHELVLGGKGRPVIGKMVVKGYEGEIKWRADVHSIETVLPQPEGLDHRTVFGNFGQRFQGAKTEEERQKMQEDMKRLQEEFNRKQREFYMSEAGRKHHFAQKRYALNFAEDGTFRIEDVPGGKYRLRMDLREGDEMTRFQNPPIAFIEKEIEVPDSPGGRTDEPFDVGTIELTARGALKPAALNK